MLREHPRLNAHYLYNILLGSKGDFGPKSKEEKADTDLGGGRATNEEAPEGDSERVPKSG